MNWKMPVKRWEEFAPEPYLRHAVVEELISGAKRAGIYSPLEGERDFPKTWSHHPTEKHVAFLSEGDNRFADEMAWEVGSPF